jgi:serine/threonine-protein phosphatase 2A regulatory subunit B
MAQAADRQLNAPLRLPRAVSYEVVLSAQCRRVFSNAHAYHINSIAINSDQETFISADDLRVNLWNLEVTDQSFNIVDIKPTNMEDLTEVAPPHFQPKSLIVYLVRFHSNVHFFFLHLNPLFETATNQVITSADFHPSHCNVFAYSSSKGCIRMADMRSSALCDKHSKIFEEQETGVSCHLSDSSPLEIVFCFPVFI